MEEYVARCNQCGHEMTLEKVIRNGAVVFTARYKCPSCGKKCIAEFDKFYVLDKPDLYDFDANGYDQDGFDADGYDRNGYDPGGFDKMHMHKDTSSPFNPSGYDWEGYDAEGLDERGFDREGFYRKTGKKYDEEGYDWHGYKRDGYNKYGIDRYGKLREGIEPGMDARKKRIRRFAINLLLIIVFIFILQLLKHFSIIS